MAFKEENKEELSPEVQAKIDFANSVVSRRQMASSVRAGLMLGGVIIIVLVVWLLIGGHKTSRPITVVNKTKSLTYVQTSPKLQNYNSTTYGLSFSYPGNWNVTTSASGVLSITSQLMHLVNASGKEVPGEAVITINKQGQLPSGYTAGTALAVLNSTLLSYTSPASSQSAQTYISFVQYSSTNIKGGLNAIFVTGNYGYLKDNSIPTSAIDSISPFIMVNFNQCVNASCSSKVTPLTIASSSWTNNANLSQPITNLLESFIFN